MVNFDEWLVSELRKVWKEFREVGSLPVDITHLSAEEIREIVDEEAVTYLNDEAFSAWSDAEEASKEAWLASAFPDGVVYVR